MHVTDSWHKAKDESKFTVAIFLDVSKAVDCVNHDILLSKLACHGVLEHSLAWFVSYLSCRKQRVCMQGLSSMWGEIRVGVPQVNFGPFGVQHLYECFTKCCAVL